MIAKQVRGQLPSSGEEGMSWPLAMTGVVRVGNPPPRAGFRQRRPSLSKEGSYLGTSFTDVTLCSGPRARCSRLLNRSFSRECALPCGLAFQMHLLT